MQHAHRSRRGSGATAHAVIRAASKANGDSEEMLAAMRATDRWRAGRSEGERAAAAAAGRPDIDAAAGAKLCLAAHCAAGVACAPAAATASASWKSCSLSPLPSASKSVSMMSQPRMSLFCAAHSAITSSSCAHIAARSAAVPPNPVEDDDCASESDGGERRVAMRRRRKCSTPAVPFGRHCPFSSKIARNCELRLGSTAADADDDDAPASLPLPLPPLLRLAAMSALATGAVGRPSIVTVKCAVVKCAGVQLRLRGLWADVGGLRTRARTWRHMSWARLHLLLLLLLLRLKLRGAAL